MTKRVIEGDYYAVGGNGNYQRHQKIKVHCHDEESPRQQMPKFSTKQNIQEKQSLTHNYQQQYDELYETSSPQFRQPSKNDQYDYQNENDDQIPQLENRNYPCEGDDNFYLSRSSHTEQPRKNDSTNKLKGILKRSLNSPDDFQHKRSSKIINSPQTHNKLNLIKQQQSGFYLDTKLQQNYNDMINSFRSVNSDIDEDARIQEMGNGQQISIQSRILNSNTKANGIPHRRNNSNEIYNHNNFPTQFDRNSRSQHKQSQQIIESPRKHYSTNIKQKDSHRYNSNPTLLDKYNKIPRINLHENHYNQFQRSGRRETTTNVRNGTEGDKQTYRLKSRKNKNQRIKKSSKPSIWNSSMLNDRLTVRHQIGQEQQYNYDDDESQFQDQRNIDWNQFTNNLTSQLSVLGNKISKLEQQLVLSEHRIIRNQLERQIKNKDKQLDKLVRDNERLKNQYLQSKKILPATVWNIPQFSINLPFLAGFLTIILIFAFFWKNDTCAASQ